MPSYTTQFIARDADGLSRNSRTHLSSVYKNSALVEYSNAAVPPVAATMLRKDVTPPILVRDEITSNIAVRAETVSWQAGS